jgi:L-lactate dehydrogenase
MKSCHDIKVAVIGTGKVGATTAFALMSLTEVKEIVLLDSNFSKAEGEAMDLNHGLAFLENKNIYAGTYEDIKDADFVIVTAGVSQKPGETRIDLASRNIKIIEDIIQKSTAQNKSAVYIIVSNPVDLLTHHAVKISGLPRTQVIGSGTNLDSSRFRFLIGKELDLSPTEVNAYILGEHGDSEFPLKSHINVEGISINSSKNFSKIDLDKLYQQTKNAAYEVIKRKEATYYAIGLSVVDIIEDMIRDQRSIKPLSVTLEGEYKLEDVTLSVPVVVGKKGIEEILEIDMTTQEQFMLRDSASKLKKAYSEITD